MTQETGSTNPSETPLVGGNTIKRNLHILPPDLFSDELRAKLGGLSITTAEEFAGTVLADSEATATAMGLSLAETNLLVINTLEALPQSVRDWFTKRANEYQLGAIPPEDLQHPSL